MYADARALRTFFQTCAASFDDENKDWDEAVHMAFREHSLNFAYPEVLLKVAVLNQLYPTRIFYLDGVTEHIIDCKIDPKLSAGDLTVVDLLSPSLT